MKRAFVTAAIFALFIPVLVGAGTMRAYPQPVDPPPPAIEATDAELVIANCSGCHSLDYVTTQPRGMGAQFWRDAVGKMIRVYKAPIKPADSDAIAAALAAEYG